MRWSSRQRRSSSARAMPDVPMAGYETMLNRGNRTRLSRMIEQFETIQEMEPARGIPGDTMEEVRAKGFSIYEDANPKLRRPNTLVLYGNDALAAVGMGVSAPPLQTPEEIKRSEEHTSELQSLAYLVCRLLLEKKK